MKKMLKTAVLDVGGTYIKHAVFINDVMVPDSLRIRPVDENAKTEDILIGMVQCAVGCERVHVCMPGPMDYSTGKSMMRHKFRSLYGIELKTILRERTGVSWIFIHDVISFLTGVNKLGEIRDAKNPAAVTLGTGLGYAYQIRGVIQKNDLGSPAHPLWNEPFNEGILEDVASGRGLAEKYNRITGKHLSAEEISEQARRGDRAALSLYAYMGECLGEALNKRTDEDGIDAIILGGQVSRSAELFVPRLREKVKIPVYVSQHIQDASLYGAAEISDDPD